ncbi:MAG: hypothetical protein FD123_3429 [Bacteroidetes bacterium]|nr:MAG: hypothetical protein FD123_3429 [Bacteroidota bacterium]
MTVYLFMPMNRFRVLIALVLFSCTGLSQEKKRYAFFELAGSGGVGSLNYEQSFLQKEKTQFTWRAGLSFAPIDKNNGMGIVLPFMANAAFGASKHKLEFGLGQALTVTTKGNWFILAPALLGYRYENPDKKIVYRVSYTPLISWLFDFQVQQWGGLSIGYKFTKP